ncbi:hypothetical protein ACEPAG_7297 [Sanghuangporus baumii]
MAPIQVARWIKQAYPKPAVNSEWLDACCTWIADEMHLNPVTQTEAFTAEVENQLLESDLRDSMEPGTGLPRDARAMNNQRIRGSPHILVEVTAIMEVGHSAFNLHNVRQARIERADLAGLAQEEGAENDEGSIPNYPRTMLRLEISDGTVTMPAIEYRSLPSLKLDETPLGFKLLLKDVLVRRGIIFLEPNGIVLKGHRNSDRDELRERDFVHGLLRRMMKPIPQAQDQGENGPDENQPPPQGLPTRAQGPATQARAPLREISEPPEFREDAMDMDDEADLPRKRRIPNPNTNDLPPPSSTTRVSSSASSTNTLVASHFFGTSSSTANNATAIAIEATTQRFARVLSPVHGDPIDITDSSMEDPVPSATRPSSTSASSNRPAQNIGTGFNNEGAARTRISYEEFEFDDDDEELDAAFLDEIAKVEKEALAREDGQNISYSRDSNSLPSGSAGRTKREAERRSNTPVAAPFLSSSTATPASSVQRPARPVATNQISRPRARAQPPSSTTTTTSAATIITQFKATSPNAHDDVITIDDEDDDDKENVPVAKRRVRRRLSAFPPPSMPDDVIDISD